MLSQILNRMLGRAEEINGRERCPTCLYRWTILQWLYLTAIAILLFVLVSVIRHFHLLQ
jgi:hypothetical protein